MHAKKSSSFACIKLLAQRKITLFNLKLRIFCYVARKAKFIKQTDIMYNRRYINGMVVLNLFFLFS